MRQHEPCIVDQPSAPLAGSDLQMFDLTPVPLWIEDYSGIKAMFDLWRAEGVSDLRAFLMEDATRVAACSQVIKILRVNLKTLQLFGAASLDDLCLNLATIFRNDMLTTHIEELTQLWDGQNEFVSKAVNYTISGRRLDIQLKGVVLPGHEDDWACVLVSTEDVTELESTRRRQAASEQYSRGLFEHSPISLWVEDFSAVKKLLDEIRMRGISDFRVFTDVHPEFVERCMSEIRVVDVNAHTLRLFEAPDKDTLMKRLREVLRDNMHMHFREQLVDLWEGKLFQQREVVNYTLGGDELHLHMQFSVFPGREDDWSLVQVALTDITARKKAEAYLEFLGKHDVLTRLHNRSFYVDEMNRLERKGPYPVTIIVADLNGLKDVNDQLGHAAGDAILRRAGEVLNEVAVKSAYAARIGGDEFAILLPGMDEADGVALMADVERLVDVNNQFYSGLPLSFAMGAATARQGDRLEAAVKAADLRMYESKRQYYAAAEQDRRVLPDVDQMPGSDMAS
jgi:diguanylate cyclase (GGDEF)-like protein